MALGVSSLINNIRGSIQNLGRSLGLIPDPGSAPFYPDDPNYKLIQSTVLPENWLKLSFPYTFAVMDIGQASNNTNSKAAPSSNNPFGEFALPLAPQSINQSEEFAVSIKPTQGGTTVTHSGNRYKTLSISGTTGIAPFRGDGGVDRKTGEAIFQPRELKYKSGYEVFIHLRNWFRTYYEFKKINGKQASNLRLVFKNYKDGEFLIVELLKFEMDRQAARPFLYDYKLEFKVLSHFSFKNSNLDSTSFENNLQRALDKINQARGVFLRTQGILRQIESTYSSVVLEPLRQTSLAIKALRNIPLVAADIGDRIIRNTVTEINTLAISLGIQGQLKANRITGALSPGLAAITLPADLKGAVSQKGSSLISEFNEGLMELDSSIFPETTLNAINEEQIESTKTPRSFYENAIENLERVRQNAEDFFNLGSSTYDNLFNRTSTLSADFTKIPTNDELDILAGFNDAIIGLNMLLATEDLFKTSLDSRIQDMIDRFDGNIELFSTTAVKQYRINRSDTLERIAQRELGDSTRWGEIVELNNLKPPYISDNPMDTRSNVVKVGDLLLIPTPVLNGFSNVPPGKENKLTSDLSELEKSFGVDFKLTKDFDLSLSNSGDFELAAGVTNMAQAVILKLMYEPGEVIRYPNLGGGILPGKKFPELNSLKDAISFTLLQDNRISKVEDLALERENGSLFVSFNVKIKNVDIPIPVKLKI